MKNNTFEKVFQNLILAQSSKIALKANHIINFAVMDKKAGLLHIVNSIIKLSAVFLDNLFYDYPKSFIFGHESKFLVESCSFSYINSPMSAINFWFSSCIIVISHSQFKNFHKGLLYTENSDLKIVNSTFSSNNWQNIAQTSYQDIFSAIKISNTSCKILSSNFSSNINLFNDAGVI